MASNDHRLGLSGEATSDYYSDMFEERFKQFSGERGYHLNYLQEPSTTPKQEEEQFVSDPHLMGLFEEFVEAMNDKSHEAFNKFLHKVEKEEVLHKLKMSLLGSRGAPTSNNNDGDRGLNVDSSMTADDIRGKLERFKVKTVNLAGVGKQDAQK